MQIKRLNMDSSWHIVHGGSSFILDPWLTGSEIDGFSWLNEQWHVVDPVPPSEVPACDIILISQSYEDHCHLETLGQLDATKPILATTKAFKRLKRAFPRRDIRLIPERSGALIWEEGRLSCLAFRPRRIFDPIYFALALTDADGRTLFYAPHGFTLDDDQLRRMEGLEVDLLITTFTDFRIPEIMGGHVNPGEENALQLCAQLTPRHVINTHDEPKRMKGLVSKLATVSYPDLDRLENQAELNFMRIDDYATYQI